MLAVATMLYMVLLLTLKLVLRSNKNYSIKSYDNNNDVAMIEAEAPPPVTGCDALGVNGCGSSKILPSSPHH